MAKNKLVKNQNKQSDEPTNSFHISNTYQNFNVNIIPNELAALMRDDPEFVKDYLAKEQAHRHKTESDIISIEKGEQEIRKQEMPYYRRFAFRGQIFSYLAIFASLGVAVYSLYQGGISVALGSILVAAITITPQLIGAYQAKNQTKNK